MKKHFAVGIFAVILAIAVSSAPTSAEIGCDDADTCFNRSGEAISNGEYMKAVKDLKEAVRLSGGTGTAEMNMFLAVTYVLVGDFDRALEHAEKAVELAPDMVVAAAILAGIHAARAEFEEGEELMNEILEEEPEEAMRHDIYDLQITVYLMQGKHPEAADAYAKAMELDSTQVYLKHQDAFLKVSFYGEDEINQIVESIVEALECPPRGNEIEDQIDFEALRWYGESLKTGEFPSGADILKEASDAFEGGDFRRAAVRYSAYLFRNPNDADAVYSLAESFRGMGAVPEAVMSYRYYLRLAPEAENREEALETIRGMVPEIE